MSTHSTPEGEPPEPRGWTDPRYADVLAHVTAHAEESGHRPRRRGFPFGGVRSFVVPGAEGRRVVCCACLHAS